MEPVNYDNLNWANDKEILSLIKDETLYYSNKIQKINHYNISQERCLILTTEALYNLQKKKLKRRIRYEEIKGITFTKLSSEFVVHGCEGEYDYHFQTPDKNAVICLIAKFYEDQTNTNIRICEIPEKSLKNYVTGKKEKKKDGLCTKMDENYLINTKTFIKEVIRCDKKLRQIIQENVSDSDDDNDKKEKISIIFNNIEGMKEVCSEDFQILKILGRGAYDKVYLVQHKPTKEYYAMKSFKIEYLKDEKEISKNVNNIRNLKHPFLIEVNLCFTTEERIYFIMSFVHGEDLLTSTRLNNQVFDEGQIKIYAAIIGLAIECLHMKQIILKDLRLDNIIIEKDGYLKVTSFKICQLFNMKEELILIKETSEFLAPEVITSNQCQKESDWWSYGVILYQLLFGIPPFYSMNDNKIREHIVKQELRFPKNSTISDNAKNLLKLLLVKNPKERLGHNNGFEDIKKHKFFEKIDFDKIINRKIEPDYKPALVNILKTKENNVEFTYEDLIDSKILIN